jgi:nucleoside-diphosphate-sugar epimerase
MTKPVIGITGPTGFIGSALVKYFTEHGYKVIQFSRNSQVTDETITRAYDLTASISDDLFCDVDILIHCAFIKKEVNKDAEHLNYSGTKQLIESSRKQSVKKIIFFSTVSAHEQASSAYGKSKFSIHDLLDINNDVIVQCSLVIGNGGLFHTLLQYALTHKLIPLIGKGQQIVQLIVIEDVLRFIEQTIIDDRKGIFVLANNERLTYRQVFEMISRVYKRKLYFIPIPVFVLKTIIGISTLLRLQLPVSRENIAGFESLKLFEPSADLKCSMDLVGKLEQMHAIDVNSCNREKN